MSAVRSVGPCGLVCTENKRPHITITASDDQCWSPWHLGIEVPQGWLVIAMALKASSSSICM